MAFGLLLWSATLVVPFLAWHWNNRTLTAYLGLSRWVKLATSLIPVHGLYYIFRIIELYDYYGKHRALWSSRVIPAADGSICKQVI